MKTKAIALSGILTALAVVVLMLSGIPFASIASPVLASLVLIPVYLELGRKWGFLCYLGVSLLGLLLVTEKEGAILFLFLGCYPILRRYFGRLRLLKWPVKLLYINASILIAYTLMLHVLGLQTVQEEFAELTHWMLIGLLLLANFSFLIYDKLIDRLEVRYFVSLRGKLKL